MQRTKSQCETAEITQTRLGELLRARVRLLLEHTREVPDTTLEQLIADHFSVPFNGVPALNLIVSALPPRIETKASTSRRDLSADEEERIGFCWAQFIFNTMVPEIAARQPQLASRLEYLQRWWQRTELNLFRARCRQNSCVVLAGLLLANPRSRAVLCRKNPKYIDLPFEEALPLLKYRPPMSGGQVRIPVGVAGCLLEADWRDELTLVPEPRNYKGHADRTFREFIGWTNSLVPQMQGSSTCGDLKWNIKGLEDGLQWFPPCMQRLVMLPWLRYQEAADLGSFCSNVGIPIDHVVSHVTALGKERNKSPSDVKTRVLDIRNCYKKKLNVRMCKSMIAGGQCPFHNTSIDEKTCRQNCGFRTIGKRTNSPKWYVGDLKSEQHTEYQQKHQFHSHRRVLRELAVLDSKITLLLEDGETTKAEAEMKSAVDITARNASAAFGLSEEFGSVYRAFSARRRNKFHPILV